MAASLLFAPGERPDVSAIAALARNEAGFSISFEPADDDAQTWVELLVNGLTFDLSGLGPGASEVNPPQAHRFGLATTEGEEFQAITLRPGPHLAGGTRMLPVIRSLAWLAAPLAALPGVRAVAWHPARCWSAPVPFRESVLRWVEGGAFPAFALAALAPDAEGGMESEGLTLFTGQELRLEPGLAEDRVAAGKVAVRMLHWLVEHGRLDQVESLTSPDGSGLRVEPSADGRFVRVWKD